MNNIITAYNKFIWNREPFDAVTKSMYCHSLTPIHSTIEFRSINNNKFIFTVQFDVLMLGRHENLLEKQLGT